MMWWVIILSAAYIGLISFIFVKTIQIEAKRKRDREQFEQEMRALRSREKHPWDG